jgi:hypothetical protein
VLQHSLTSLGGATAVNTHFTNPRKAYVSGDAMFADRHNYKISAIGPPSTYEGADRLNRRWRSSLSLEGLRQELDEMT